MEVSISLMVSVVVFLVHSIVVVLGTPVVTSVKSVSHAEVLVFVVMSVVAAVIP